MGGTVGRPVSREISADAVRQAALRIADCRSIASLRDALFDCGDTLIGSVAIGIYFCDSTEKLRYATSRFAPQGFLDQYEREHCRNDTMLDCIVEEQRAVDGFHFYGPVGWRRSANYELLSSWGFHHNMGGAFVIDGRTAGILFAATSGEAPFNAIDVRHLGLMCRAGSLALTAMRDRERLRCELSAAVCDDHNDVPPVDGVWSAHLAMAGSDLRVLDQLPARCREVARLLCRGQPNKAIAHELGISVDTVKEHVNNLFKRFGALNRTDLVLRVLASAVEQRRSA